MFLQYWQIHAHPSALPYVHVAHCTLVIVWSASLATIPQRYAMLQQRKEIHYVATEEASGIEQIRVSCVWDCVLVYLTSPLSMHTWVICNRIQNSVAIKKKNLLMNHWVSACACACVYVCAFTGEASRSGVTEPKNKCIYRFGSYFQFVLSGHFALPPAPRWVFGIFISSNRYSWYPSGA